MFISKEHYLCNSNMTSLRFEDYFFYVHVSTYAQAIILSEKYFIEDIKEKVGRDNNAEAVDFFYNHTPEPIRYYAPLLGLVDEGLPTDDIEVLTGVMWVITSQLFSIDRWLNLPLQIRAAISFTLNIMNEYQMAYDRFFMEAVPYEERGLWRISFSEAIKQFKLLSPTGAIVGVGNADVNQVLSNNNCMPMPVGMQAFAGQQVSSMQSTAEAIVAQQVQESPQASAGVTSFEYEGVTYDINKPETFPWGAQNYDPDYKKYSEEDRRYWDNCPGWKCTGPGVYYDVEHDDMCFLDLPGDGEGLVGDEVDDTSEPEVVEAPVAEPEKESEDFPHISEEEPLTEEGHNTRKLFSKFVR